MSQNYINLPRRPKIARNQFTSCKLGKLNVGYEDLFSFNDYEIIQHRYRWRNDQNLFPENTFLKEKCMDKIISIETVKYRIGTVKRNKLIISD